MKASAMDVSISGKAMTGTHGLCPMKGTVFRAVADAIEVAYHAVVFACTVCSDSSVCGRV